MEERVIVPEPEHKGSAGRLKAICWIFAILAVVSEVLLICNVMYANEIKDANRSLEATLEETSAENYRMNQQIEQLEGQLEDIGKDNDSLQDKINELSDKADFMDNYIKVVENNSEKTYHTYGCEYFDDSSFWAYNKEQVVGKSGYTGCPYCN